MKKFFVSSLVIAALVVAAAFTSCNKDDNKKTEDDDVEILFSGKFASHTGGGEAVFYVGYAPNGNISANQKRLVGKIKDGDIIFNLGGFLYTDENLFFLSAGSKSRIYQFTGTFSNGVISETIVITKFRSLSKSTDDEWDGGYGEATNATDVSITGAASASQVNGVPEEWFGLWMLDQGGGDVQPIVITPYQFLFGLVAAPLGFVDVEKVTRNYPEKYPNEWWDDYIKGEPLAVPKRYEMVFNNYAELEDGPVPFYEKMWLDELKDGSLLLTLFGHASSYGSFAEASAKPVEGWLKDDCEAGYYDGWCWDDDDDDGYECQRYDDCWEFDAQSYFMTRP